MQAFTDMLFKGVILPISRNPIKKGCNVIKEDVNNSWNDPAKNLVNKQLVDGDDITRGGYEGATQVAAALCMLKVARAAMDNLIPASSSFLPPYPEILRVFRTLVHFWVVC